MSDTMVAARPHSQFASDDVATLRKDFNVLRAEVSALTNGVAPLLPALQQHFSGQVAGVGHATGGRSDAAGVQTRSPVIDGRTVGKFAPLPAGGRKDH